MIQEILVYLLIGLALVVLGRSLYRKWNVLKNPKSRTGCEECPLKKGCKQTKTSCTAPPKVA